MEASKTFSLSAEEVEKCRPLFRWAGGKRRLLSQIRPLLPQKFNHYYEPFCGGAALFFELRPTDAILGDKNEELINCYQQVKKHPEEVIAALQKLKNTETNYYKIRANVPQSLVGRAARLIYLMALSFNGIYRVNSDGQFNVPYGSKNKKQIDFERIRNVSKAFAQVEFVCGDFATTVKNAKEGDLVYFDPPYTVAHGDNGFIQYNEKILRWQDQERLSKLARKLAERGCHVVISNADHDSVHELYAGFKMQRVERHSGIGALNTSRKRITEFVFTK
jgi:DNA adenine methylase